jgi:hypothetical protein
MEEPITKPTAEEIKEFVGGPKQGKKKREDIVIIIAIGLIILIGVVGALTVSHNSGIGIDSTHSVLNKTSGFTEADCNEICNISYPTRFQTIDCQKKICYIIGKEGQLMDINCLNMINEFKKTMKV